MNEGTTFEPKSERWTFIALLFSGLALIPVYFIGIQNRNIHWDEFYYLAVVHRYLAGSLSASFQTLHVHFFWWLPSVAKDEVIQIIVARFVSFGLFACTCIGVWQIARSYFSQLSSALVLFCLVSASHTLLFATDFRADSLAVALLIVGFAALHRDDTSRRVVVAGSLLGLALLVTLKSIFYAPVFLFFIVRRGFQTALTFLAAAAGSFISAFLFHRSILSGSASDSAWFVETAERFLSFGPEPAVLYHLLQSVNRDFPLWSMVGFGGFLLVLFVLKGHGGKGADLLAFLFLLLPLACYRNVYPYFFWFLWPGLSLLAGILAEVMPSGRQRVAVVLLLVGVSLVRAIPFISLQLKDTILPQQQVLEVVHSAFPEPVPYLDRASMVSSFPSAGFFMTSYHLERYIQGKERTLEQIVTGSGAEFLIANTPGLDLRLPYEEAVFTRGIQLTNSDWDFLKREFRHYWGPIFIRKDSLLSDKNFIAPQAAPPSEPLFLGFF